MSKNFIGDTFSILRITAITLFIMMRGISRIEFFIILTSKDAGMAYKKSLALSEFIHLVRFPCWQNLLHHLVRFSAELMSNIIHLCTVRSFMYDAPFVLHTTIDDMYEVQLYMYRYIPYMRVLDNTKSKRRKRQ